MENIKFYVYDEKIPYIIGKIGYAVLQTIPTDIGLGDGKYLHGVEVDASKINAEFMVQLFAAGMDFGSKKTFETIKKLNPEMV